MKRKFHIIFKTHLDIGFTALGSEVEKLYLENFVPGSIALAERMKDDPSGANFKWTVGSWLIHKCLNNYRGKQLRAFENAIDEGFISWHALPFTVHSELLTPSLFEYGLSLSWELDSRFGKRTRAAKMTDVPGHTIGIIPLLSSTGVDFLHLGSNPGSTPPDVPELFIWETPGAEARITVMYQKGGYGNIFAAPDLKTGLNVTFTCDNLGPPTRDEILAAFKNVRDKFPDAKIEASTFDAFANELAKEKPTLPVIRGEMGDTWIHGAGTAPGKVRRFRALCRLRDHWMESGIERKYIKKFSSFSENLLLIGEHTWGLDVKTHLADEEHFTAAELKKVRGKRANFKLMEASWKEQESYIDKAVNSLKGTPYFKKASDELDACAPKFPALSDYETVKTGGCALENDVFKISFNPHNGAVVELRDKTSKKNHASQKNTLGEMMYEVFGAEDVARYLGQYGYNNPEDWFRHDFGKPGLEKKLLKGQRWNFSLKKTLYKRSGDIAEAVMVLSPDSGTKGFGCPGKTFVKWRIVDGERKVQIEISWKDKPASRIPEAVWMGFSPAGAEKGDWLINKLGQWVSPLDVLKNGNKKLHASGSGVVLINGEELLTIRTLDAPLVAPGEPSLYNFNNTNPPLSNGMFFNLFNNIWGTNFPQWSDEDGFYRFELVFGDL